jgi:hypothetical protein
MNATRFLDVACPGTEEMIRVGLTEADLFAVDNLRTVTSETRVWWSYVAQQYRMIRSANPAHSSSEALERALRGWPDHSPEQQTAA